MTVKDVSAQRFIQEYAAFLKRSGKIQVPEWADIVKTAASREQGPYSADWYYVRLAALARRIYLRGGVGVGALKVAFGGNKSRGSRPSHHANASGAVIRTALQQLESIGIVEKDPKGGRRITQLGQQDLDRIASTITQVSA